MRRMTNSLFLVFAVILSACNLGVQQPTETPPAEVELAAPTAAETEVPVSTVEHKTIPGEFPEEPSGGVGDQDSSVTADDKRAPGGDRFTFTRFERPFSSQTMDEYYPYLDIQEGFVFEDEIWIYAALKLRGDEASRELKGRYALEIDNDLDGGGDWLVLVSNPVSTDWTTDTVEVWFDTNDDVGGEVPTTTDDVPASGNGYETLEFGAGAGDDPDFAWARISPDDPNVVHFAVKKDILQGSQRFLAGFWAGGEDLDPALFEFSDNFTHDQAGAAVVELEYFYPIKELSALDNTCRMAVGFQPTGREAGLCPLPVQAVESQPEPTGCPQQYLVCRYPVTYVGPPICICTQP